MREHLSRANKIVHLENSVYIQGTKVVNFHAKA